MGGGTWAGNNIKENLSYKHFIQITKVAKPILAKIPTEESLFGDYWEVYGNTCSSFLVCKPQECPLPLNAKIPLVIFNASSKSFALYTV